MPWVRWVVRLAQTFVGSSYRPALINTMFYSGIVACLGVNTRTPSRASEWKHSHKQTFPYHHTLTSSSVRHPIHQQTALFLTYYNVT